MRRIVRTAVLFRVRPSYVAMWPEWELDLIDHFLSVEPAPDNRIEIVMSKMLTLLANVYRKEGAPEIRIGDVMQFRGVWNKPQFDDSRYSEADRSVLETLL